jgi:hypothetical protein
MASSNNEPRPLREIAEDEDEGAAAAFIMAHPDCGDDLEIGRVADVLVCHCAAHAETLTYAVQH